MPSTVRYKKYSLKNRGAEVFKSEFEGDLSVDVNHIAQVAHDLANFTGLDGKQAEYHSHLEVTAGEDVIFIERDYQSNTVKLTSQKQQDPNFFWLPDDIAESAVKDRNPFIIFDFGPERLKEYILWALPKVQDLPSNATQARPSSEIRAELEKLQGDTQQKTNEIQQQIEEIEAQLNAQRQADQAQISIGDLQAKIEELMETMSGVDDLVTSQRDIHNKLKQYSQLLGNDIMDRAEKLKIEVEKLRTDRIKLEADLIAQEEKHVSAVGTETEGKPKFATFLLVLPLVLAIISIVGFFLTSNLYILALGIIGCILEALLFLAVNAVEPDINVDLAPKAAIQSAVKINPNLQLDGERQQQIEQFFVNKAWLSVLKEEFKTLQEAIDVRLGEKNLGQVQQAKAELQTEFDKVQKVITDHEGKDIAPEEYLKLRRKLDMLKVEKAKLADAASAIPDEKVVKLQKELKLAEQIEANPQNKSLPNAFVANANEKYAAAKVEEGALQFWDNAAGDWVKEGFDQQSLAAIFAYVVTAAWERDPSLPLALIDMANWVSPLALDQINARIDGWRNLGQVVIINAQK